MILLDNISKSYDGVIVFDGLNLKITSNLTKIEGKNGSGKSTLLKILAQKTSYKGKIYFNDKKYLKDTIEKNVLLVNQDIVLIENETVLANLLDFQIKEDAKLNFFNIDELKNLHVYELSGGQKKKLQLYIAFCLNPSILLLDEYANYLDKEFLSKLNEYILAYSKNHMVIYVDHFNSLGGSVINLDE